MNSLTVLSSSASSIQRDSAGPSEETGPGAVPDIFSWKVNETR